MIDKIISFPCSQTYELIRNTCIHAHPVKNHPDRTTDYLMVRAKGGISHEVYRIVRSFAINPLDDESVNGFSSEPFYAQLQEYIKIRKMSYSFAKAPELYRFYVLEKYAELNPQFVLKPNTQGYRYFTFEELGLTKDIKPKLSINEGSKRFKVSSWHIGIAAEAFAAAQFARYGIDVSVQYGANQPEYDLIVTLGDKMLKVSVKGSQDGGWGLTQSFKKDCGYHEAINKWLTAHGNKTIFCLVQFKDVKDNELPRMYLATPTEIAKMLHDSRNGNGETVLREYHKWGDKAIAAGSVDKIPEEWTFTEERIRDLLKTIN